MVTSAIVELPKISGYGNYSSGNYGLNALRVDIGNLSLWFSYKTVVAFQDGRKDIVVRQNDWAATTGKHLNWIDGGDKNAKAARITGVEFRSKLAEAMKAHGLSE